MVDVFGSASWGGATGLDGDLDLVVLVRTHRSRSLARLIVAGSVSTSRMWVDSFEAKADKLDIPSMWRTSPEATLQPPKVEDDRDENHSSAGSAGSLAASRLPQVYNLRGLARMLFGIRMEQAFAIVGASTPIVKFVDPAEAMKCDINVNDLGGWLASPCGGNLD